MLITSNNIKLEVDGTVLTGNPDAVDLTKVVMIPEGITRIDKAAFSSHVCLTKVTMPTTLITIGSNAFYRCVSLKSLTIPEGVTSIEDTAFFLCEGLESIILPSTLKSIGKLAFYGCKNLKVVYYTGNTNEFFDNIYIESEGNEVFNNVNILHAEPENIKSSGYSVISEEGKTTYDIDTAPEETTKLSDQTTEASSLNALKFGQ